MPTITLPSGATATFSVPTDALPDDLDFVDLATEGDDLEDEGDLDGALASYDEAVGVFLRDHGPELATGDGADHADAVASLVALLYNRSGLRLDTDDAEGARADLDAALALADGCVDGEDLADVYVRRAEARFTAGDAPGADADLDAALGHHGEHALAYNNRAAYRLAAGRLDDALDAAETAVKLDPEDVLARATLAEVHAAAGRTDAALATLEAASDLDDVTPYLASSHFDALRSDARFTALGG